VKKQINWPKGTKIYCISTTYDRTRIYCISTTYDRTRIKYILNISSCQGQVGPSLVKAN